MVSAVPAVDVVDTAVVIERPWPTVTSAGDAVIEKSGLAITTSDTIVVRVADGAVPVIAIAYVPGAVVASAASVSIDVSPALTLAGMNAAVAPAGRPVAVSAMVSTAPAVDIVDTAVVSEWAWTIVTVVGDALIEKSGRAITTNDTVVVCVADGAVPVTVTV
jgi:hypothetical protein